MVLSSDLPVKVWPPPPSTRHVPITLSGLRKSAELNSVSLSMDAPPLAATAEQQEQRRPATARPMGVTTARPNHLVSHDNHGRHQARPGISEQHAHINRTWGTRGRWVGWAGRSGCGKGWVIIMLP